MPEELDSQLVKEYTHWAAYVNRNQGYLGRMFIRCKREDAVDLPDATKEEQEELFAILKELRSALTRAFQPNWFNYSFLGNEMPHLHCHLVARYASLREFAGMTFVDNRFGMSYRTQHDFITTPALMASVRDKLKEML